MPWREFEVPDDAVALVEKKARFLVDECLGPEAARVIKELGWNVIFAKDHNLGGKSDSDVMALAWREDRILLTHDHDFLDDKAFPPNRNPGVVVLPGATGRDQAVLEKELARVLNTLGRYRDAYRGFKIHVRDDGTWAIRSGTSRSVRLLKFGSHGRIWQMDEETA